MEFFDQQREASAIKSEIVSKYFSAWARIIGARSSKIGYIDLFSGPGCYDDGTESTPMIILKKALSLPGIADKFVAIFNDASETNTNILKSCINDIPGIEAISPRISISTKPVDRAIADEINKISLIPVFSFIDPFGYAGVSKDLITALTKDNCCDCIFFLNYSRINAGITNPRVPHHIEAIFGMDIDNIRKAVCGLSPSEREATILELLSQSFQNINGRPAFVLPFRFRRPPGSRGSATSHYLIFLTKHILGYSVMKDIMHNAGGVYSDGIGNFEFVPVTNSQLSNVQLATSTDSPVLFTTTHAHKPLDITDYLSAGERITKLRNFRGWSKATLSTRAGLSVRIIQACEFGRLPPSIFTAKKLADALRAPLWYVGGYDHLPQKTLAEKMEKARKYRGHTKEEMAAELGVNQKSIYNWSVKGIHPLPETEKKLSLYIAILRR